jgi:hypothetical protein
MNAYKHGFRSAGMTERLKQIRDALRTPDGDQQLAPLAEIFRE